MKDNFDRHFYLYAKGHYVKTDVVEDLKTLVSKRCMLEKKYITENNILSSLLPLVYKHITNDREFGILVFDIANAKGDYAVILWKCLLVLHSVKVRDADTLLIDLGKADENVLPVINFDNVVTEEKETK